MGDQLSADWLAISFTSVVIMVVAPEASAPFALFAAAVLKV